MVAGQLQGDILAGVATHLIERLGDGVRARDGEQHAGDFDARRGWGLLLLLGRKQQPPDHASTGCKPDNRNRPAPAPAPAAAAARTAPEARLGATPKRSHPPPMAAYRLIVKACRFATGDLPDADVFYSDCKPAKRIVG